VFHFSTNENPQIGTGALPDNMVSIPVAEYEQMKNEIQEHAQANEIFEEKLRKINDDLKDCKTKEGLQVNNAKILKILKISKNPQT
jgi:hypothetical protein